MDVQELMSQIAKHLSVGRVFGEAYEKDATLVIPVAFVAGGGWGGEGTAATAPRSTNNDGTATHESHLDGPQSGSGGGFGGVVLPVGVYVVKDDRVRWVPAVNANLVIVAFLLLVRMMVRARRRARRRHG